LTTHSSNSARANAKIHDAVDKVERELKELIDYLDREVVPTVRTQSSRAMRVAASKLAKKADYIDEAKNKRAS
jgi:hypothetical protein